MEKMVFTIYAKYLDEATRKLNALVRKANKYNCAFNWTEGEHHVEEVAIYSIDPVTKMLYRTKSKYNVEAIDIDINFEGMICASGWRVVARIEHGESGNIINAFENATEEEMENWRTCRGRCDHCHTNRFRAVTFIVKNESGEVRQIGRSCLKDYTGINPITAAAWAEVKDFLDESNKIFESDIEHLPEFYDVRDVLEAAVESIKTKGYIKSSQPNSTKQSVTSIVHSTTFEATEEVKKQAQEIYNWLVNEKHDTLSIEANASSIAKNKWCKSSHFGYLAFAPVAYQKEMEKRKRKSARAVQHATETETSNYIGEIGKRIAINLNSCKLITSWESAYGYTYLYKMVDNSGNVFIWFASSPALDDGHKVKAVKATIKAHNERDGVKQTVLTRVKAM